MEEKARIIEEIFNLKNLGKKSRQSNGVNNHTQIGP